MNRKSLQFTFTPLYSLLLYSYIILFYLLTTTTLCSVSPKFEACEAKTCGNQSISYPFYIIGLQQPFCGYPGFGISCNNTIGFPILNLSNTEYIKSFQWCVFKTRHQQRLSFTNAKPHFSH